MMKLNLNDISFIINDSKRMLIENTSVSAAYRKYFSNIPEETYQELVSIDPTYNKNKPDVMGKYGVWILNQYKKGNISSATISLKNGVYGTFKIKQYLEIFTKFINRIENKNLQSYKSPEELENVIQPFIDDPNQAVSNRQKKMKVRNDAENVYEDSNWVVIIPRSWEASKVYGANTKWCTTMKDNSHYYDRYSSQAPLYIVINKHKENDKYQIHMPSNGYWQFKGTDDREVSKPITYLGFTEGLVNFFDGLSKKKFSKKYFKIGKKYLGGGLYIQSNISEIVLGNKKGKKIDASQFEKIGRNYEGFVKIKKDGKFNYLNEKLEIVSDIWFDNAIDFYGGIGRVRVKRKYNAINKRGNIIYGDPNDIKTWLSRAMDFPSCGLIKVTDKNKVNFINSNGKLISDTWFDNARWFRMVDGRPLCPVSLDGKMNMMNKNGKLIMRKWADGISLSSEMSIVGYYNEKTGEKKCGVTSNFKKWEIKPQSKHDINSATIIDGKNYYIEKTISSAGRYWLRLLDDELNPVIDEWSQFLTISPYTKTAQFGEYGSYKIYTLDTKKMSEDTFSDINVVNDAEGLGKVYIGMLKGKNEIRVYNSNLEVLGSAFCQSLWSGVNMKLNGAWYHVSKYNIEKKKEHQ